ncbi:AraC-like DNA-binding protein [Microbacterium proteolyticum]|uniref:AraC-like DNA-binding protein n=1 Tax=Microbacterium proteolyticum TaxID=1572644 RepID=A0A7W5GET8_9MICO|nr:AraC family transcriptional regulator [Microbacterium proteolyticum]MBB3157854.1 AraC-like DNA-binding protein [Microbacterium proteolyticum]
MTGGPDSPTPSLFFTPRRPVSAQLAGRPGLEAMGWHSAIKADPASFRISLDLVVFDNVAIARTAITPSIVVRTPEHVASLRVGSTFYFLLAGSAIIVQGGVRHSMSPGTVAVISGYLPFELIVPASAQMVTVLLKRGALDGRGVQSPETDTRVFSPSPYVALVTSFVTALAGDLPGPKTPRGVCSQQALLHLLIGLLLEELEASPPSDQQENRIAHALAFIEENYSNADLSTADVAVAVGVSVRHLQRILTEAHTSVSLELRRSRLRWASVYLLQKDRKKLQVDEIARLTGFGNVERLRRAFVHDLGTTPAGYRITGGLASDPGVAR